MRLQQRHQLECTQHRRRASTRLSSTKSRKTLGKECLRGLAGRGSSEGRRDEFAGVQNALNIHTMLYAQAVKQKKLRNTRNGRNIQSHERGDGMNL
eukprot:524242-Pelagomonas_calceolata.AAC.9